jgi:hypothetical protein
MKLEKFDLEKALNGAKVVTRDGREVKQLTCFDTSNNHNYPLYGVIGKDICCWARTGQFNIEINNHCNDLFLAVEPIRRSYANVYLNIENNYVFIGEVLQSEQLAKQKGKSNSTFNYIKTIEITDEL